MVSFRNGGGGGGGGQFSLGGNCPRTSPVNLILFKYISIAYKYFN